MKFPRTAILIASALIAVTGVLTTAPPANAEATDAPKTTEVTHFDNAAQVENVCKGMTGLYAYKGIGKPYNGTYVPVLLIHGWKTDTPEAWSTDSTGNRDIVSFTNQTDVDKWEDGTYAHGDLPTILKNIPGVAVFAFQYAATSKRWITNPRNAPKYVEALNCLKKEIGQKVIVIGHSMGGLMTHYAVNNGAHDAVSRVITLATPNTGSRPAALWSQTLAGSFDAATNLPMTIVNNLFTSCKSTEGDGTCGASKSVMQAFSSKLEGAEALAYGSKEMLQLEKEWPWPTDIPVDSYGGDVQMNILGTGIFKWNDFAHLQQIPFGDLVVTPDSAKAGATTYMQVTCHYRLDYHITSDWNTGQMATGAMPQSYNEDFGKFDNPGTTENGWTQTDDEKTRRYDVLHSSCLHMNITHNARVINDALKYVTKQVEKQQMQFSTYDQTDPSNADKWTIGYDGVGPFKVGMTSAQIAALDHQLYGTDTAKYYNPYIKNSVERAYQTGTSLVNEPGWAGYMNGRMLTCDGLTDTYTGVRGLVYTPVETNPVSGSADAYIKATDPYNKSTMDEIIVADGPSSMTPKIATPGGITMGTSLAAVKAAYGNQKLITINGQKVYQLENPSNPAGWDNNSARSSDENYTSINFFIDNYTQEVDGITVGKLIPTLPNARACQKDVYTDTTNQVATYDKNNPSDISKWTIGFDGLGPIKLGATADKVTGITGIDFSDKIKAYATASHNMDKGQSGAPQNQWGGMSFCAAGDKTGHTGISIQTPAGTGKTYNDYETNTKPYTTSTVKTIWADPDNTYPQPGVATTHYFRSQLPTTKQGTGVGSYYTQIAQEYGADRTLVQVTNGSGLIYVFPSETLMNQWFNAGEGDENGNGVNVNFMEFEVDGYVIQGLGASINTGIACEN